MTNKTFRFGPLALTDTLSTNILNPPTATGGVNGGASPQEITLKHIRIVNKTSGAGAFSLWLGGTGGNVAGTEFIGTGLSIPANQAYDWYSPGCVIKSTDFLVGGANANTTLTIEGEGEIGVQG